LVGSEGFGIRVPSCRSALRVCCAVEEFPGSLVCSGVWILRYRRVEELGNLTVALPNFAESDAHEAAERVLRSHGVC
jgi:hypothetical protein